MHSISSSPMAPQLASTMGLAFLDRVMEAANRTQVEQARTLRVPMVFSAVMDLHGRKFTKRPVNLIGGGKNNERFSLDFFLLLIQSCN